MTELYSLRCKIAHIKGYFTSVDLDKLVELTNKIAEDLGFVIIEESGTHDTFLGHRFKFTPPIENLTVNLKGKLVTFIPVESRDTEPDKNKRRA